MYIDPHNTNKLLPALDSLLENLQNTGIISVDMADFLLLTKASDAMYLVVEEQLIDDDLHLSFSCKKLPQEIKSIWIDLKIGSTHYANNLKLIEKLLLHFKKLYPHIEEDIILSDTYVDTPNTTLAVLAFN